MKSQKKTENTPLRETLSACKIMLKYILLFGCITNFLMLASPLYSMQVLDRVLSSGNLNTLLMLTIAIIFSLSLLGLIQGARAFAVNRMGSWFEKQLSEIVLRNSVKMSLGSRMHANSQQIQDLNTVKSYLTSPALVGIIDTPWAIIFLITLFILNPAIGWLTVIGGAISATINIAGDISIKPLVESYNEHYIKSARHVEQTTRNAEVVEVMGLLPHIIPSWQKINKKVHTIASIQLARQTVFSEIFKLVRSIVQISVTGLGAYLVVTTHGGFTSGAIIASSSLVGRAFAPLDVALSSWRNVIKCMMSYKRLNQNMINAPQEDEKMKLPDPIGEIDVEGIYYFAPGTQVHIIKGVSLRIVPGRIVGVIGPSGSGKTTLSKLIVGALHPSVGAVRIDGASIKDWRRDDLGPHIGYLPQDVEMFSGTVMENIARMNEFADSDDVIKAAQLAGVHDLVLQLPKAYDTDIGIDGSMLSGGQRQRIGLARALFGDPKILVLDEPTSNLDDTGKKAFLASMEYAKEEKKTVIIVTHEEAMLKIVDDLMVVKAGSVIAYGPRDEIVKKFMGERRIEE